MYWWHWEAMLITYLSTRRISLPFNNIPELVTQSPFRIILIPGTSYEDAFKTSRDEFWKIAWTDRVQPHLEENRGLSKDILVDKMSQEGTTALYDNYFSIM